MSGTPGELDMREIIFRGMPQQYLIVGMLFLILGTLFRHGAQAEGVPLTVADFLQEEHGTLMVFFGIIPIFFVAGGYGLVPSVGTTAWPFLDRFPLVVFYVSAGVVVMALSTCSLALFFCALGLNLVFAIAAATGFITRVWLLKDHPGKRRMPATAIAFVGLSLWIIITFALLEFAAIRQVMVAWLVDSPENIYVPKPNDVTVPLIWKHLFWFLGHPEAVVILTLIGGLIADGVRNLFWRRAVA